MKMKFEHFEFIKNAVQPFDTDQKRKEYALASFTHKRYRWDIVYEARLSTWICDNLYSYLNDDHIDTALRKIVHDF
jgi:hypothetical protein